MHVNPNIWLILLLTAYSLVSVNAQTTNPATDNKAAFQELKQLESAPQPPPALQHVASELSGTLLGRSPNLSIEFVLTLQNNWSQEVKLVDPLEFLYLQITTAGKKSVDVPYRVPKAMIHSLRDTKDMPFPSPIVFRRIVRDSSVSREKEELITISPGKTVQIIFESEPVVMERVMQALQNETGEGATSFKARATVDLVNAPLQAGFGGRLLQSDWILFTMPSSR